MDKNNENNLSQMLTDKFSVLTGKSHITRNRRIFVDVPKEIFLDVIDYAAKAMGFDFLCTITGLDIADDLQFIYHLANKDGILLNIKVNVPKSNPEHPTVMKTFNGSIFYERELIDMFGAKIEGLPEGRRYPLPDWWPLDQHPLRKDWKPKNQSEIKVEVE